jgi:F0F1-type ATP synthase membrane subunit b/b'
MMTNSIIMAGQVAGALSAIGAVVYVIVKYVVVKPIQNYIDKATYPISPTANGGKSLPDVIRAIKRVEVKIEKLDDRVQTLEDTLKVPQSL